MNSSEIRSVFLNYFKNKGHKIVKSSSLVPDKDPTLLFTNAGMNQFKNVFLGIEKRDYKRATSSQKCMRAGGKHNDLEQVGKTDRHHTFFEMLGNFSFGDYFKKEAIEFAWELLTEIYKIPAEKLYITIFKDDDEAFNIWNKVIGLSEDRIIRMGAKDNFWEMGDTGPCGPCTEIHYDRGEAFGDYKLGEQEGERYIEIWNLVFMEFQRDEKGNLTPLPSPSIDTGMGLERLASILQDVPSNFETDLFMPIIKRIEEITGKEYEENQKNKVAMRVIADHVRAITFLISDGVLPSNEGRGYVLRRVIRRAFRYGKDLGLNKPFLYELTGTVVDIMGDAYPEIVSSHLTVANICKAEEERFYKTLDIGYGKLLELVDKARSSGKNKIDGKNIFTLYDTYGFPPDLAKDILEEHGMYYEKGEFDAELEKQRERARSFWKGDEKIKEIEKYKPLESKKVKFIGYTELEGESEVIGLFDKEKLKEELFEGETGEIVTSITPFYGEAGGQVGDTGIIENENFYAEVFDTQKPTDNIIIHKIKVKKGKIKIGDKVFLRVDKDRRWAIKKNHTTTHLLHKALREILGPHVKQSGSKVAPDILRFDFTHFQSLSINEIEMIEELVNRKIQENLKVNTEIMSIDEAVKTGAMAIFEEKYGETVRVVSVGDFSKELCGGTHLDYSGEIGLFKILSESSVSAGVRRIEAVTGLEALRRIQNVYSAMADLKMELNTSEDKVVENMKKLKEEMKFLIKERDELRQKLIASSLNDIIEQADEIKGKKFIFHRVDGLKREEIRTLSDNLKNKIKDGVVVLYQLKNGKLSLVFSVTKELSKKISAKELIKFSTPIIGGGGGGRDDFGEAGGSKPENIELLKDKLKEKLKNEI